MFLETEGSLATSLAWQQLQPTRGTLVEGIARLPRQLIGGLVAGVVVQQHPYHGPIHHLLLQMPHALGRPIPQAPNP